MAQDDPAASRGRNTGWAILTAIGLSFIFYIVYRVLFTFVVAAYAQYDPRLATGLGALVLLVFGPNVLGVLSGAAVAKAMFKQANKVGLFYGIATFMVVTGGLLILTELGRTDASWFPIVIGTVVVAASIVAARVILLHIE